MTSSTLPPTSDAFAASNAEKTKQQELALARIYCWLVTVLHPGWAILLVLFLPDQYNDLIGRSVIGVMFFALGVGSYLWAPLRERLPRINELGYSLFAMHWFWIVHQSDMASIYVIGSLVVSTAFNFGFTRLSALAIYSFVVIGSSVVTVFVTEAPIENKFMLVTGMVTSQVVGMSFLYARTKIVASLEAAETRALRLQQQLIERELEAAQAVQQNLLAPAPSVAGLRVATYYKAAARTGGDWFGHYYDGSRDYFYFWIGDVTGHGISSALVTGVVCGALYSGESRMDFHGYDAAPAERIKAAAHVVNNIICDKGGNLLMTMLFGGLDLKTGELTFTNAGHRFPLIVGDAGEVKQLTFSSDILGLARDVKFDLKSIQLRPGDTMFAYTDGLVENMSPTNRILDRSTLKQALAGAIDSHEAVEQVRARAEGLWADRKIDDDITMLALTWRTRSSTIAVS